MKLTLRLIKNLQRLLLGESIPYSALPKPLIDSLVGEGLLYVVHHGTRRALSAPNLQTDAAPNTGGNKAQKIYDALGLSAKPSCNIKFVWHPEPPQKFDTPILQSLRRPKAAMWVKDKHIVTDIHLDETHNELLFAAFVKCLL